MWAYNHTYSNASSLEHTGVKGMKWGVRREMRRNAIADFGIRSVSNARDYNKKQLGNTKKVIEQYYAGKDKKIARLEKRADKRYERTEISNKFFDAVHKARKDKAYKKTPEYQKAKHEYAKAQAKETLKVLGVYTVAAAAVIGVQALKNKQG